MATVTPTATLADDALYEVVNGQVVEKLMGAHEIWCATQLVRLMIRAEAVDDLGQVVPEGLFVIDQARDLKRRPDVAFVSYERWPRGRRVPYEEAWDVVPDLVVEVVSQSNTFHEVLTKVHEYFEAGVRLVWAFSPKNGQVYAYDSPKSVRILDRGDVLDGAPLLPGFRLELAGLFEEEAD